MDLLLCSGAGTPRHQPPGYGLLGSYHVGGSNCPLCGASGELVEIPHQGGISLAGRCGAVCEEKSNVVVFVSSGKSQHDDCLGAITSERAPLNRPGLPGGYLV